MNHILTIKRDSKNLLEASCSCGWLGKHPSLLSYVHELSNEWREHVRRLSSDESTFIIEITFKDPSGKLQDITRFAGAAPIENMTDENLKSLCYALEMMFKANKIIFD